MLRRFIVILFSFLSSYAIIGAQNSMPIIAYMGVPNDKSTITNFKAFRECGFDVSLYGYASLKQLVEACRVAEKCGVRILGHCPETHDIPEYAAKILMKEKGFFGYVLQDEPSAECIKELQKEVIRLKSVDKYHPFYINLHPFYADWTLVHTKTKSYEEYLRVASSTSCQQISFDFYPIEKQGIRSNWYSNLEMVRNESLRSGKPFWGFVLSVPHVTYPQPTLASLRLQIYSNLVYGAQAIQYFTYWTPEPTKEWDFHNGPISQDGEKTSTYFLVQKMNKELRPIADLFYNAQVKNVKHLGKIPQGTKRLHVAPLNINGIKVEGKQGAIVSHFVKNGKDYLAIVNKDYQGSMKLRINAKSGVVRLNKDMREEKPVSSYKVEPGDIVLFKLK